MDTPLFSLTNSFDIKWKTLEATVDFDAKHPIIFGATKPPDTGWQLRISPDVSISSRGLFNRFKGVVKAVGALISVVQINKGIRTASIAVRASYRPIRDAIVVEIELRLLQW